MAIAATERECPDQAFTHVEPLVQDNHLSSHEHGWDSCLEQLFVVHQTGSIVLFTCHFQGNDISINSGDCDNLYGAAIGMMDNLLGEILASKGHVKEITLDQDVLSFTFGKHCCFILVTANHFNGLKVRLDAFAADFESCFAAKLAGDFNIDVNEYEIAISLVEKHFYK